MTQCKMQEQVGSHLSEHLFCPTRTRCSGGTVCWDYSTAAASDASHFVRVLILNSSGHLVYRHMGFVLGD